MSGDARLHLGRRMLIGPIVGTMLVAGAGFSLRLYMSRPDEDRLHPGEAVAIAALRPPLPGNAALACPPDYCAVPDAIASPVFAVAWQQLLARWVDMIAREPRIVAVGSDMEHRRFTVIQHSALFHFPDIVTVEFVELGDGRSSPAVYSRSRYGRGDFGVNRQRVLRWLAQLERAANQ